MSHLLQEFPKQQHVNSSHNITNIYSKFDGSNMINFGIQNRRTAAHRNYSNQAGIEFRTHNNEHESESAGVTSPPLWKSSPPTETTPLQSHSYNHHHYRLLSPTSRLQAIARGKEELMEMVNNMSESCYELSLKDLVDEHSRIQESGQTTVVEKKGLGNYTINSGKKRKKNARLSRSGSMNNNGPFLLKMFVPNPLGLKNKKNSTTGPCAKVSPKPIEGENKFADKDWWKRRLSVVGESEKNGSSSISGSSASSDNSRSRKKGDFLPGCWSFLINKNS